MIVIGITLFILFLLSIVYGLIEMTDIFERENFDLIAEKINNNQTTR